MALVEPAHVLTYTWTIYNYNYFAVKVETLLHSPKFDVKFVKDVKFYLMVQRVPRDTEFVGFYICKEKCCSEDVLCKLSIRKLNGQLQSQNAFELKGSDLSLGFKQFVANAELGGPDYVVTDLTLSCSIWKRDTSIPATISRFVYSMVKITEINYTWEIDNALTSNRTCKINQNVNISADSPELPSFNISVSNEDDTETIVFAIQCKTNKSFYIVYTVNILLSSGKPSSPFKGQRLFDHSLGKQSFAFSLVPTRRLISNKRLYLKNNKLTVCCHFIISTNEYGGVYLAKVDCASKRSLENSDPEQQAGLFYPGVAQDDSGSPNQTEQRLAKKLKHGEHTWKKGWTRIIHDKEFSDLIIRTPQKQFSVHKAVLSSHSEVFHAMLKHDMKEQNSGVIDIEDLEDDTIEKMLQYLYMGRIDDMDCFLAQKLYFAADKYRIIGLLNLSSTYLESHLDASNVCYILVLADIHQDQQLKSCAEDFIVKHASEIIDSEDWREIMETHLQLSAITMKRVISKNLTAKSNQK